LISLLTRNNLCELFWVIHDDGNQAGGEGHAKFLSHHTLFEKVEFHVVNRVLEAQFGKLINKLLTESLRSSKRSKVEKHNLMFGLVFLQNLVKFLQTHRVLIQNLFKLCLSFFFLGDRRWHFVFGLFFLRNS